MEAVTKVPNTVVDQRSARIGSQDVGGALLADEAARARAALVVRAQAADPSAFEQLVGARLDPAFRLALGILGNEADARDATQDAFISAWRNLPGLRDPAAFDGWLTRIVVNSARAVIRLRRTARVREISVTVLVDDADPASHDRPVDEQASETDALERAFARLDAADRTILVLHHLEHQALTTIAETLGIPVGTAKSRLFAARRALERALEAER